VVVLRPSLIPLSDGCISSPSCPPPSPSPRVCTDSVQPLLAALRLLLHWRGGTRRIRTRGLADGDEVRVIEGMVAHDQAAWARGRRGGGRDGGAGRSGGKGRRCSWKSRGACEGIAENLWDAGAAGGAKGSA